MILIKCLYALIQQDKDVFFLKKLNIYFMQKQYTIYNLFNFNLNAKLPVSQSYRTVEPWSSDPGVVADLTDG